ncbi:MAG TPA: hypothetical protein GXZ22_04065 [Clostridiaceae bacterium]|nr:hypothetical protein [Clostridiaceae bacterium]
MSGNIEKILYLGLAVVLLGMAFTFFFSGYNNYRDYITKSNIIINDDRMVAITEGKDKSVINGTEVIHQVLEFQKLEQNNQLLDFYSDLTESPYQSQAEIWVSGIYAIDIKTSDVDAASLYGIVFEKDNSGQIIKVQYSLK